MLLQIEDWQFDVDITTTMNYHATEVRQHCDCAYCRNFYTAVDDAYPGLRPFLAQFGVEVEAPEELMPFEPTNVLCCYAVEGRILHFGSNITSVHGLTIHAELPEDAGINAGCQTPYFVLSVGPMELPWVLNEQVEEVLSPANEPGFLRRMIDKLLRRAPQNAIES
jgi:hypothetical protein